MSERRGTRGLELWCRRMTEGYPGVKVENMTTSWRDGLAFCAIIHHFRPDLIDFSKLNKDDIYHNNELAFRIAERHLGIPALLEPEDMVEYSVPDRLSILTYLSQFYQAFVASQGSPSRIVPKRPATTAERPIVSPTSTPPSSKVPRTKLGVDRRDPCAKCGLPVFIAERLSVGKLLFHRTCFRCARCNSQLTLANYYETESDQFCCETCPDEEEEEVEGKMMEQKSDVLTRSLSDEEKSANLKKQDETSPPFDTALENPSDSSVTSQQILPEAMSHFVNSQIEKEEGKVAEDEEKFPELPKTQPPDIRAGHTSNEEIITNSAAHLESYDSGFPHVSSSVDLTVNKSIVNDDNDKNEDQPKSADIQLDTDKVIVTKENESNVSIVKARMKLFEPPSSTTTTDSPYKSKLSFQSPIKTVDNLDKDKLPTIEMTNEDSHLSKKDKDISRLNLGQSIDLGSDKDVSVNLDVKDEDTSHSTKYSKDVSRIENFTNSIEDIDYPNEKDVVTTENVSTIATTTDDSDIAMVSKGPNESSAITISSNDDSVIIISDSNDSSSIRKEPEDYPEDLNPFGSDGDNDSLNPFKSDDDDNDFDGKQSSPPKATARKKIIPLETFNKARISNAPQQLSTIYVQRISENPFEESDDEDDCKAPEKPVKPTEGDKKASLNPFMSDDEESEDESLATTRPVPKPRNFKTTTTLSTIEVNGESMDPFGSMSSVASSFVSNRRKKIAPPPPSPFNDSDHSSITSSPSPSAPHSPRMTPRSRKTKKAPLPPTTSSSTPFCHGKVSEYFQSVVSPLNDEKLNIPPPEIRIGDYETEKINKDKENRSRQSKIYSDSADLSQMNDKSTHGKWKRRKGPAPSRPIPQRRQIKPLPVGEIKRELELIEVQQQGLERQGVRLEQIIRERCEGPNCDPEGNMSPEVEELILQLFELVNEKNDLFRKQAELMYLRRQQRLEEEYADLEYQIRCLMLKPEPNITDSDKAKKEEELINRLLEVVERRNEIVECLEMDRLREAEEDTSITNQMHLYTNRMKDEEVVVPLTTEENKKEWKKKIKKKLKLSKSPKMDADKDIDESEQPYSLPSLSKKEKKKKKFNLF